MIGTRPRTITVMVDDDQAELWILFMYGVPGIRLVPTGHRGGTEFRLVDAR